jgi:hypothetical protein
MREKVVRAALAAISALAAMVLVLAMPASASSLSPQGAKPPGKAAAPPTDLRQYPKRPAPHIDPAKAGKPVTGSEVIAIGPSQHGIMSATIYTPAPGVTPERLYLNLKAQGVRGLVDPAARPVARGAAPATANSLTSCTYGTAIVELCQGFGNVRDTNLAHQLRWADGCCAHPQVWFVDHTGSQWPVTTDTYEWNIAHGVDSLYIWGSCPNYSGQYCVNVNDANYGCSGWEGQTFLSWNGTSFYLTSVRIELNDAPGCTPTNASGYRQDVCQEEGHALGMGHNSSTDSCMHQVIINNASAIAPDSDDFTLIAMLYNDGNE